jgi:hypothetical protein
MTASDSPSAHRQRRGETPHPPDFRQLLARDGIPIYHPVHVDADEIDWHEDTLVIGVARRRR